MLLTALIFLPLLFALIICVTPKNLIRPVALVLALVEFGLSLGLLGQFDKSSTALQMGLNFPWVPELGISYFVGVDGLSLGLVLLTTFLTPITVLGSWTSIDTRVKGFFAALFVLETSMLGSFLAMDAVLFYAFFELSLIPMFFMVGVWGGARRVYATMKFFLFTMAGSLLMLLGIIYLMFSAREVMGALSSNMLVLYQLKIPFIAGGFLNPQTLLFSAFALAFAIKTPLFPLHTWQPDAYVEAPTPGSLMLSSLMSKLGAYGFLRFVIPLFPEAAEHFAWLFIFLGVVGIIYGALIAMIQPDMKRLIAYSSLSHMGFIIVGLFALNDYGVSGSVFQMISHGLTTGALFLLLGMLFERTGSFEIKRHGGLAKSLPIFTIAFFIVSLASISVPLTNGFIGEFLILMGTFKANQAFAVAAVFGVILSAAYMLWMIKNVFFGQPGELVAERASSLRDMNLREVLVIAPIIVLIFWMGVFPNHFLDWSRTSAQHLVQTKDNYQLAVAPATVPKPKEVAKSEADN